jgi:hypothetical protein
LIEQLLATQKELLLYGVSYRAVHLHAAPKTQVFRSVFLVCECYLLRSVDPPLLMHLPNFCFGNEGTVRRRCRQHSCAVL